MLERLFSSVKPRKLAGEVIPPICAKSALLNQNGKGPGGPQGACSCPIVMVFIRSPYPDRLGDRPPSLPQTFPFPFLPLSMLSSAMAQESVLIMQILLRKGVQKCFRTKK